MNNIIFKSISFVEGNNFQKGYFFYNAAVDSDYGHIFGVKGLTLPMALFILKEKGIDAVNNYKMSISVFK